MKYKKGIIVTIIITVIICFAGVPLGVNYVSTQLTCRGDFIKSNESVLENNFELSGKEPMCFWNGNIVYSEKDVTARIQR